MNPGPPAAFAVSSRMVSGDGSLVCFVLSLVRYALLRPRR